MDRNDKLGQHDDYDYEDEEGEEEEEEVNDNMDQYYKK